MVPLSCSAVKSAVPLTVYSSLPRALRLALEAVAAPTTAAVAARSR